MMNKEAASATLLALFLGALILLLLAIPAHCSATSGDKRINSLGVTQTYENQFIYMFGSPSSVSVFEDKGRLFTNVSFKPFGATLLYHENVWFCGNQEALFGDTALRIVVYRRTAERVYKGTACHEMLKVVEVDLKEGQ